MPTNTVYQQCAKSYKLIEALITMNQYNVHACQDTNLEILSYDSFPDLS